jgi:hypothetical protein
MSYLNVSKKSILIFVATLFFAFILQIGIAGAASSSLSGETTAKPGDTVSVTMSFSGSNTVAVGVIYSYNSCISSVSAGNASPWGNTQVDANQIGVGDYSGYESGSWNYILNGTTSVVSFSVKIADDATAGDVAILKLNTVYYATTSNTLEQVSNQNLPTAGTASISITIEEDAPAVTDTPTPTPEPQDSSNGNGSDNTEITNTPAPTATPTPTKSPSNTGSASSDFLDTTPIVPGDVFDSIDDNYHDSSTGGYVIAATRDDRGKTTVYEVATDENNETVYIKKVVNDNGDVSENVISEEDMNAEMADTNNYLADKEDSSKYNEATSSNTATAANASASDNDGKSDKGSIPYAQIVIIIAIILVVFGLIYFLLIRKFKEHTHIITK